MQQKNVFGAIIAVVIIACGFAVWKLHTNAPASSPAVATNSGWKVYQDTSDELSFEYPSTFAVDTQDNTGYSDIRITDPITHAQYLFITVVNDPTQSNDPTIKEIFTGPYPKQIPATSNAAMTVDQKTFNGLQGIEMYGYIAEGSGYSDEFMYRNNHLWEINLDPVLEGRITAYPQSGTPTPDKDIYEKILASLKISS